MLINRLHLDGFGVLVEDDFEFLPGLNVIIGANEAGKSTLQQALLTMLYGFYHSDRLTSAEKKLHARFRPWVGNQYGGSLYLRLEDDTKYLIQRRFDSPEPETQIYIANTGADVTNQFVRKRRGYVDFCERQLGMSQQVFTAVACVLQGQITQIAESEASALSDAIIRLIDSATADVSVRQVLDRLATAIRAVGTEKSRSGPWFRAKQTIAECQADLEKRKDLTLSLERDYSRAGELQQELQELEHEKAELKYRLQRMDYSELQHILQKHDEIQARQHILESQLGDTAQEHGIMPERRDEVVRLMEERKHLRRRRQELFSDLDSCESNNKSYQKSLDALPVEREFWYGDGPTDFLDLKRQWLKHYIRMRESKVSQENLQRAFGQTTSDEAQAQKVQELDSGKVEEMRNMSTSVSEQQDLIEAIDEEMTERQGYLRMSRIGVTIGLFLILAIAAIMQLYPQAGISTFIEQYMPNSLEYLAASIIALWLAFEGASILSMKTLQEDLQNADQTLRLMQHELKEMLAPFQVKTFDELLNMKLKYIDIRKADEEINLNERQIAEIGQKLNDWVQKFGFENVSQESLNQIETIIQEGKRYIAQTQKLTDEIEAIDTELAQKDERLVAVTTHIRTILEQAHCWSDRIEEDVERFITLADAARVRESAERELEQLQARDRELLRGMQAEDIREQLRELKQGLQESQLEPDIQSRKTIISRLEEVEQKSNDLSLELATIRERISERESRMPDLSEIEETIAAAQAQIDDLTVKRRALELAFETLSEVAHKAHRDFAPQLASIVGEMLAQVTDERYQELYIDPATFSIRIARGKNKTLVPVDMLSFGTREQIYLLMRAAIAQLFSGGGESVPLFLDDPLTHADDTRQAAMLRAIADLARQHQIFYFTKDQSVLDNLTYDGTDCHLITLRSADAIRRQTRRAAPPIIRIEEGDL